MIFKKQTTKTSASQKRYQSRQPRDKKSFETFNKLRIIGLGGLEEVGRNMTLLEFGSDIIIVDMGLMFPEEDMPGIDYIIPDISYLQTKKKNIRGVIITHGHYDHIGAISHLVPPLGFPTIYTSRLTAGIIRKRHEEFKMRDLNIAEIDPDKDRLQLGKFTINFFRVNHNIPDSFGLAVQTPVGTVVHTGDFKIDFNPINDKPMDLNKIAQIGSNGVLALMSDSTDAEHSGYQISEREVAYDLDKIFQDSKSMIFVGTFASLLNRVQQLIWLAEKHNRKVFLDGRSMKNNVELYHQLGYLKLKPDTLVEENAFSRLPREKIVVIGTGAQGEKNAVLNRIAHKEHKFLEIEKGDSVIFSSSVIPGNERSIQNLKDTFYRQGAKVYHYKMMDVHAGGHAKQEDLKLIMRLLKPKYFMPIEANYFMRVIHGEVAQKINIPEENILLPDNGQVVEFTRKGREVIAEVTKEKIPTEYIMVDGLGVGDVSNIVIRDRQVLADDGMFVVIVTISKQTGTLVGSPDIISRGFVYMKESKKLIEEARTKVKKICKDKNPQHAADTNLIRNKIRDEIGKFLFKKTKRRPMVLPVVIEV